MRSAILLVLSATLLTACASIDKHSIDTQGVATLKSQTVVQTTRAKPDFTAMTAGKAAFALLGAIAMISAGNEIIAVNNVQDPADAIGRGLAQSLEQNHGARFVKPSIRATSNEPEQISSAAAGKARFIIDVQTINWSFAYFPSDWTHYRVIYVAKARLIDAEKKAVVAEGVCKQIPASNTNAPTHDELMANQAALLKATLASAANECVKIFNAEMLSPQP